MLSKDNPPPPDLTTANKLIYEPSGLIYQNFANEAESEEYGASVFELNDKRIKFRIGKITPTKIGQFVTLWKRNGEGITQPHDQADPFDFFVISVRDAEHFGQFVFPKPVLVEKGIVSKEEQSGKRGIRIYPPWDVAENKQAKHTQAWQLLYFLDMNAAVDIVRVRKLFT